MKTLTSLCFAGCLFVVIALQVTILRNQRDKQYQPTDEPTLVESADAAIIELGAPDVAEAATAETGA